MQIHIETADRYTDALIEAVLPFLETRLSVLSGDGTVFFTDDETWSALSPAENAGLVILFYRHETWLTDPAHRALVQSSRPYTALPWPVSVPALEEALHRIDAGKVPVPDKNALRFLPEERTVRCGRNAVRLTDKEYRLLTLLYENRGEAVDKTTLIAAVWPEGISGNVCEVNMTHLRQKLIPFLGDGAIISIRGKGYILRLP